MGLHDLLSLLGARRRVARLATTICRRSLPMAAAAVGERMFSMRLSEARGYIRARSRLAVMAEIEELTLSGQSLSPRLRNQLVEMTLEQVVGRLIAQRMVEVQTTLPLRRAA